MIRLLTVSPSSPRVWNPFHCDAVYWQGRHGRLHRFITLSFLYHLTLALLLTGTLFIPGCRKTYDLVKGTGKANATFKQMKVEVKKKKQKHILVNPDSPIIFTVPEEVKLDLQEATANEYKAGQADGAGQIGEGEGDGPAGYSSGREGTRFIFVRVRYDGGNWDYNLHNNADENMTVEFGKRSHIPVSKTSQDVTLLALGRYVKGRSPPVVFMVGSNGFRFDDREAKALRSYLLENRGMLLADNGGSGFHGSFLGLMRKTIPEVMPVEISDDDPIYRAPYFLHGAPPLWAHSGTRPLGWKKDGRWIVFYHQGSLTDAWKDSHGGTTAESAEQAYQLGVNILAQAMSGYSEWKRALDGKNKR